ncbi:hypothetical protein CDAR_590741 [Caerostris darwini]|uniref:Uncharacterized protein n=1 Tax=Caerostris darwini TaxID=1538125 RepID=A0AAV4VUL9_9ARAC|nr:hypothetical protein CDAR_590741 [Caerostris darwini]
MSEGRVLISKSTSGNVYQSNVSPLYRAKGSSVNINSGGIGGDQVNSSPRSWFAEDYVRVLISKSTSGNVYQSNVPPLYRGKGSSVNINSGGVGVAQVNSTPRSWFEGISLTTNLAEKKDSVIQQQVNL